MFQRKADLKKFIKLTASSCLTPVCLKKGLHHRFFPMNFSKPPDFTEHLCGTVSGYKGVLKTSCLCIKSPGKH